MERGIQFQPMMRWIKTLRARFTLWTTSFLLIVIVLFGTFIYFNLSQELSRNVDNTLRLSTSQIISSLNEEDSHIELDALLKDNPVDLLESGQTVRLFTPDGNLLNAWGRYRFLPVIPHSLEAALKGQNTFMTVNESKENEPIRIYTAPVVENDSVVAVIQVMQSLGPVIDTLKRLFMTLWMGGILLLVLAALGGYRLAARALAPIDQITKMTRQIAAGQDLSARLNLPTTEDEIGRLAEMFDTMLSRLEESFHREHQFIADASHELRTPLAAIQTILNVTCARRRTPSEYEQALDDLSFEVSRLQNLVETLLQLERARQQTNHIRELFNFSQLLSDVIESVRPLADTKGLTLTLKVPDNLAFFGDTDGLIRLFINLLDNAIKYTEQGGVTVQAFVENDMLVVTVIDTGVGISPESLPYIFNRFYRVETSRTSSGTGLGLAIAYDIVRAHGGTIEVTSQEGVGTSFVVRLPQLPA